MVTRDEINNYLNSFLEVDRFTDYGPNGLQVEGRAQIARIVSGVTASLALIEAAAAVRADAIVVHHGLFWRGQDGRLTGWMKQRVAALLARDINLFAYHLPLDAHTEVGNNAQLAAQLKFTPEGRFGEHNLGCIGTPQVEMSLPALSALVQFRLGRTAVVAPGDGRMIKRVAWCSGGAQDWFESAVAAGADAYITGEISEPQAHLARETGVAFLACGHHATERYGAKALGTHLAYKFELQHEFIDIDNPA